MSKEVKNIIIRTDYITLGQLLKFADVVMEGGEAKAYLVCVLCNVQFFGKITLLK